MIKSILVPLDESDLAEESLPIAEELAGRAGASVHLLEVVPPGAAASAADEARHYLQCVTERMGSGVQAHIRLGDPAEQIVDSAERMPKPIIVMTTHGRSGLGRWLFGSVAERVVHGTCVPVLLLRSGATSAREVEIRSILVPLDGSALAEMALPYAQRLARLFDAQLHLVRVVETPRIYSMFNPYDGQAVDPATLTTLTEDLRNSVIEYLTALEQRLQSEHLSVHVQTLEGFASQEILLFERNAAVDLVVMTTHSRAGLNRLVFGSVAENVFKLGTVPVMLIHPDGVISDELEKTAVAGLGDLASNQ